jgi:hypothetical protein
VNDDKEYSVLPKPYFMPRLFFTLNCYSEGGLKNAVRPVPGKIKSCTDTTLPDTIRRPDHPGSETKVILLGDPNQIDWPYLDAQTNGLFYASEHM